MSLPVPMAEQSPQEEHSRTISRFSTSTSLRMPSAADNGPEIVPMPRWSTYVGCARLALSVLVLVFTSAATAIWGGYASFAVALFTSSASLVIFAYYFIALSLKPGLYNRWAILNLEIFGVIFWLVTFSALANWTNFHNFWFGRGDGYGLWNTPYSPWDTSLRSRSIVPRSTNKYHAGVGLAGTSAGLAGIQCILYMLTLIVFGMSLHNHRVEETRMRQGPGTAPAVANPNSTEANSMEEMPRSRSEARPVTV